jgi:hypothetical protein
MAKEKPDQQDNPTDMKALIMEALKTMKPEDLRDVLGAAGAVPTTMGMDVATLQSIVTAFQATSATAVRETLRQERKENPSYPERSVFNPRGVFDDHGKATEPKHRFRRATYFQNVRLGGELETETEIDLCNAFTEDKSAREGRWTARIEDKGRPSERLYIQIPSKTVDDRMENSLPFAMILRELLDGADAVNTETLQKQIADMAKRIQELEGTRAIAS